MSIFPEKVVQRINELGYHVLNVVPLLKLWSVIVLKGERKFNIQLTLDGLEVVTIHRLHYKFDQWGNDVVSVEREWIDHKKPEIVSVKI
ncbi:hypothetical protein L0244_12430 [bacterium]|nr:hypothetical protein [Nitrososphaera sp.]MCI0613782.1 hypothetical protein [bacterium]